MLLISYLSCFISIKLNLSQKNPLVFAQLDPWSFFLNLENLLRLLENADQIIIKSDSVSNIIKIKLRSLAQTT